MKKQIVTLTVNGKAQSAEVEARCCWSTSCARHLGMTGTHIGCDTTNCGACTVLVNGDASEVLHAASPCRWTAPTSARSRDWSRTAS